MCACVYGVHLQYPACHHNVVEMFLQKEYNNISKMVTFIHSFIFYTCFIPTRVAGPNGCQLEIMQHAERCDVTTSTPRVKNKHLLFRDKCLWALHDTLKLMLHMYSDK